MIDIYLIENGKKSGSLICSIDAMECDYFDDLNAFMQAKNGLVVDMYRDVRMPNTSIHIINDFLINNNIDDEFSHTIKAMCEVELEQDYLFSGD